MPLELIPILALVAMFVMATVLPINMGALASSPHGSSACSRSAWTPRRSSPASAATGPHADRRHLPVRDRQEQRHRRLDRARRGAAGPRPGRRHPVDDVRGHRVADRHRRGQPRGVRDHRADRPRVRRAVQDQPAADGHDGRPRRPGGGFSPISIYGHDQQDRRKADLPASKSRSSCPACSSTSHRLILFFFLGGRPVIGRKVAVAEPRPRRLVRRGARPLHRRAEAPPGPGGHGQR